MHGVPLHSYHRFTMNPEGLRTISFNLIVKMTKKCNENRSRYEQRKYWEMVAELPGVLKGQLLESLGKLESVNDDNISYLISNDVKHLCLYNCFKSDFTVQLIGDQCHRIVSLDLGGRLPNHLINAESLLELFSACNHLTDVRLNNCVNVNDQVVECLALNCENLRILKLSGCLSISDNSLKAIADYCTQLRSIDVSRTAITDDGLCYFVSSTAKCIDKLTELLVNECSYVSNISIQQVILRGKKLETFSFLGTRADVGTLYDMILTRSSHRQIQFNVL